MRANPAERYPSAEALLVDLRALDTASGGATFAQPRHDGFWWWQFHQYAVAIVNAAAPAAIWTVRHWAGSPGGSSGSRLFLTALTLATISVALRPNLAFTSRVHPAMLVDHRARLFPAIAVIDALLALLPAEVDGVPLTPDWETAAELARDAALGAAVQSIAVATAFGPIASDGSGDYVVVTMVGLRPRTFSDGFFRDWRDSFDGAVCDQAGGVSGHAEAEIGGHPTWIGTCEGGVHTWHATLHEDTVIVSLQGSGAARYGEQVIAGLTE